MSSHIKTKEIKEVREFIASIIESLIFVPLQQIFQRQVIILLLPQSPGFQCSIP
jgi:hypothetical protein